MCTLRELERNRIQLFLFFTIDRGHQGVPHSMNSHCAD
ncbi:hypothetical protein SAMN05216600_10844 [Pseudomonas cuatrocienegasensis]|uniref:Uncharacterized protein n=1 Tax=Pseudomonas cuatrocienegasensis TaxID=543360 RepID=A0ABY1BE81_9PSED|nr:hypothetical protein SAMN05216600_10844 [Pseudomonas cuatrocienegasensis]